eukprot:scaffold95286_cov60-Phaeocystis_antarctica.AAC.11
MMGTRVCQHKTGPLATAKAQQTMIRLHQRRRRVRRYAGSGGSSALAPAAPASPPTMAAASLAAICWLCVTQTSVLTKKSVLAPPRRNSRPARRWCG